MPKIEKSSPQYKVKTAIKVSNGHVPHLGGELRQIVPPTVYGKENVLYSDGYYRIRGCVPSRAWIDSIERCSI
jgi:hypothetical protein